MKRNKSVTIILFALILSKIITAQVKSTWVYQDKNDKLVYKTTPAGDKLADFSYAGYMGGGVPLPIIKATRVLHPSGKDDTKDIQAAIDEVAAKPLVKGFRGAVELGPGVFICSTTLSIHASGIVLRGSGSGKNGTTIKMTGSRHTAIVIGKLSNEGTSAANQPSASTKITDAYVPSGTHTFTVADAGSFSIGDLITISKPVTDAWIQFMQMDNLNRDGRPQKWIATSRHLDMQRRITAIEGNQLTIDVPLTDAFDARYINSPGVSVTKINTPARLTQVGVEHLHIQCPPLEIAYGNAPYAGIRIGGDDCWVKDVYCEETMNTTTLAGNRITMQQVVITHTYPNLGASKPTDFSIEGSQNLIDRCESTGGNTYFVWTGSLAAGPNVLLNCTFRGHGSRIQPHQRWSTGLLVDNCTVIDGGIDFMNRGVAGSGHGWTMGWTVAWNCIAKTYIIQNPPGAANWAIGCIGERQQTARLFDTSPVLPEGIFDSHGTPVAPQSLYLAQLAERLGSQAFQQIGYASNTVQMFNNKQVKPSLPLSTQTDKELGLNLALHRPVNTSQVRGNTRAFGGEKAIDGHDSTYWATNDGTIPRTRGTTLEIDMEGPVEINAVTLAEAAGLTHVQEYKVEGQVNSDWKLLAHGTTIGVRKVDTFPAVTVWKVRLTIIKADTYPAIKEVGLYMSTKR